MKYVNHKEMNNKPIRGFASIGLQSPKQKANVGCIIRAAGNFGVKLVVIESPRLGCYTKHAANTMQAHKHYAPTIRTNSLIASAPASAELVAVELIDSAVSLPEFQHPENAFYLFGPEDGSLDKKTAAACKYKVFIPTFHCMNLAATVHVVLYDRAVKRGFQV